MPEERALGEAESLPERELLRRLELELPVPEWFTFPEVLDVLRQAHPPRRKQGFTVFLTGLSGSGKSTLAKILYVKFMQAGDRPVTLLDGDIVRKNLSSELNFSREHRDINIRRIGFVASQITKNRGIAICAPIAPYEESRRYNRELISRYGGYLEVYVSTPLSVCEARDVKGLYAKARAGLKKGVTGIDDPYEAPVNPDLSLDTSNLTPTETAQRVVLLLREMGYVR
jgi:sulfate adenylyltransferase